MQPNRDPHKPPARVDWEVLNDATRFLWAAAPRPDCASPQTLALSIEHAMIEALRAPR
jgi:hypothetical protein